MKNKTDKLIGNIIAGASFVASMFVTRKLCDIGKEYYRRHRKNDEEAE